MKKLISIVRGWFSTTSKKATKRYSKYYLEDIRRQLEKGLELKKKQLIECKVNQKKIDHKITETQKELLKTEGNITECHKRKNESLMVELFVIKKQLEKRLELQQEAKENANKVTTKVEAEYINMDMEVHTRITELDTLTCRSELADIQININKANKQVSVDVDGGIKDIREAINEKTARAETSVESIGEQLKELEISAIRRDAEVLAKAKMNEEVATGYEPTIQESE